MFYGDNFRNPSSLLKDKKEISLSTSLAGQAVGIKEVDDGNWLVGFMDYGLGECRIPDNVRPAAAKKSTNLCQRSILVILEPRAGLEAATCLICLLELQAVPS